MSPSFEWDPRKDAENQRKHGVVFAEAQLAFLDPSRVIAKDLAHSSNESRFIVSAMWRTPFLLSASHTAML